MGTDNWVDDDDLDAASDLTGSAWVSCPYCGREVELLIDPHGGAVQEYIEACEVCCNPWNVRVSVDDDGNADVSLSTLDDE